MFYIKVCLSAWKTQHVSNLCNVYKGIDEETITPFRVSSIISVIGFRFVIILNHTGIGRTPVPKDEIRRLNELRSKMNENR